MTAVAAGGAGAAVEEEVASAHGTETRSNNAIDVQSRRGTRVEEVDTKTEVKSRRGTEVRAEEVDTKTEVKSRRGTRAPSHAATAVVAEGAEVDVRSSHSNKRAALDLEPPTRPVLPTAPDLPRWTKRVHIVERHLPNGRIIEDRETEIRTIRAHG